MLAFSGRSYKVFGLGAAAFLLVALPAAAEDVTEAQILKALSPPKTRSLSLGAPAKATPGPDDAFVDSLRNKQSSALSSSDRAKLDTVSANKPMIDLTMEFDLNSAELRGAALADAHKLGKVLSGPELKGQTFVIAGHTDVRGGESLNQGLSERRADAVKQFLVRNYRVPAETLISVGYGKTHLKNQSDPQGKENRRVQTVNMLQTAER